MVYYRVVVRETTWKFERRADAVRKAKDALDLDPVGIEYRVLHPEKKKDPEPKGGK